MEMEGKNPVILVSFDSKADDLIFEDSEGHKGKFITTSVWRNHTVMWKVVQGEKISIDNIYPKSGSQNVLEGDGPMLEKSDGSWKGVVKPDAKGKEAYNVDYTINGVKRTADPELDVRDGGGDGGGD